MSLYIHQVLDTIGITDTRTQTILNGCISIYKFVISVVASLFVERAGRRPLFIASTAGMLVSFIIWTVCSARKSDIIHAVFLRFKCTLKTTVLVLQLLAYWWQYFWLMASIVLDGLLCGLILRSLCPLKHVPKALLF